MKDEEREPVPADGEGDPERTDRASSRAHAPGRRRRRTVLVVAGIVVVALACTVGALGLGGGGGSGHDDAAPGRSSQVVRVARTTLTDQTEVDGQLGHGPQVPFPVKAKGTVTWLPATGTTVRRGQAVLRVDDRPVVLLYGSLPMYRDLAVGQPDRAADGGTDEGASTDGRTGRDGGTAGDGGSAGDRAPAGSSGKSSTGSSTGSSAGTAPAVSGSARAAGVPLHGLDVKQFESNLSALGYSGFTVDESYTDLTANAVKRWQKDLGLPQTGTVGAGDVVYAPGPVRIAGTSARVGDEASGDPVSYTSTSRMVTVNAPAADTDWAQRGSQVTVDLPDGRSVKGTVASLGADATAVPGGSDGASDGGGDGGGDGGSDGGGDGGGDGGSDGGASGGRAATVSVVITFDDPDSLGRLQSGPVTVRYTNKQRKDVLAVPVAALTALAEGGYGLEPADGATPAGNGQDAGPGRFVAVRTGLFAQGMVEVSGPGVHEGMKVRIPK